MRVFLVGYMGSGKTTVGKKLSRKMNISFFDLDHEIEKKTNLSISQLFEKIGELEFRIIENKVLYQFFDQDNFILSCGGGTPIYFDNMIKMNENGITVYLKMNTKAIHSRLKNETGKRPLLKNKSQEELESYIENHLNERIPFYEKAKIKINSIGLNLNETISLINTESKK